MPSGAFRHVILLGQIALKIPRIRNASAGLRCNRWEREVWRKWRLIFGWENLCPVRFADPLGAFVVMVRATQPVTREEVRKADKDYYPAIDAECKPEDWGRVDGRVLALDYGLSDADMVRQRREYYMSKARNLIDPM